MNLPAFIQDFISVLESNGFQTFVVGGCVRDSLLGIAPDDWDICTSAKPQEIQQVFSNYTVIPTGMKHGTLTIVSQSGQAEITTFRTESEYCDARHPETVTFVSDIMQDLARRDFTINAMAYSAKSGLIDPYGGEQDLKAGILRCVGEPDLRMQEDALRILRALRFSAVYQLKIDNTTDVAIHAYTTKLSMIAKERIWSELKKILLARLPGRVVQTYSDVLEVIFERKFITKEQCDFIDNLPRMLPLRLTGLVEPISSKRMDYFEILQKLKIDKRLSNEVLLLLSLKDTPLPASLSKTRQMVGEIGSYNFQSFLLWKSTIAKNNSNLTEKVTRAKEYFAEIQEKNLCCSIKDLAISGRDLISVGIPEGGQIGSILRQSLDAVIHEVIPNEKNAILNHLFL